MGQAKISLIKSNLIQYNRSVSYHCYQGKMFFFQIQHNIASMGITLIMMRYLSNKKKSKSIVRYHIIVIRAKYFIKCSIIWLWCVLTYYDKTSIFTLLFV